MRVVIGEYREEVDLSRRGDAPAAHLAAGEPQEHCHALPRTSYLRSVPPLVYGYDRPPPAVPHAHSHLGPTRRARRGAHAVEGRDGAVADSNLSGKQRDRLPVCV